MGVKLDIPGQTTENPVVDGWDRTPEENIHSKRNLRLKSTICENCGCIVHYKHNMKKREKFFCKTCYSKHRRYRDTWGQSEGLKWYQNTYRAQEGKCAICQNFFEKLYVDHDHNSGKIRSLLCNFCNIAVGYVEKIKNIQQYQDYINSYKEQTK